MRYISLSQSAVLASCRPHLAGISTNIARCTAGVIGQTASGSFAKRRTMPDFQSMLARHCDRSRRSVISTRCHLLRSTRYRLRFDVQKPSCTSGTAERLILRCTATVKHTYHDPARRFMHHRVASAQTGSRRELRTWHYLHDIHVSPWD